ncbi:YIP1 family protein [Corallincola platygyrae]|uniref:YIP1 family protein n=1 Tax=Corallincola platygyrae TaxID=1193278 RepID=A0ABW4XM85_9GAMM
MSENTTEVIASEEVEASTGFAYLFQNIHRLFFQPSKFFSDIQRLQSTGLIYVSLLFFGMSNIISRVDSQLIKSDLGAASNSNDFMLSIASEGWFKFWALVTVLGAISGFFTWLIGGWFFNLRLSWSGAKEFEKEDGRTVFLFSNMVEFLPHIISVVIFTLVYSDYFTYFKADELWSAILFIFPFWSVVVCYKGIRANFDVVRWRAMIWFVVLPLVIYLLIYAGLVLAYLFS